MVNHPNSMNHKRGNKSFFELEKRLGHPLTFSLPIYGSTATAKSSHKVLGSFSPKIPDQILFWIPQTRKSLAQNLVFGQKVLLNSPMPTRLHCTGKMTKWIGKLPKPEPGTDPSNSWNIDLIKVEGRQWLLAVHYPTCFSLLFSGIRKSQMKDFAGIFHARWVEQMEFEGILFEKLPAGFLHQPLILQSSNNNRRNLGIMNEKRDHFNWFDYRELLDEPNLPQSISADLNDGLHLNGKDGLHPRTEMANYMLSLSLNSFDSNWSGQSLNIDVFFWWSANSKSSHKRSEPCPPWLLKIVTQFKIGALLPRLG